MKPEEKQAILDFCDEISQHDLWMWGSTAAYIREATDFDAPTQVEDEGGRHYIKATMKNGQTIDLGRSESGWSIGWGPDPETIQRKAG